MKRRDVSLTKKLVLWLVLQILKIRYRWDIKGLEEIQKAGDKQTLFLANHPALIDPVLLVALLYPKFKQHTIADEHQIQHPIINFCVSQWNVHSLPNLNKEEKISKGKNEIIFTLKKLIAFLKSGENIFLYPSGHIKRGYLEKIGGSSSVETIVKSVPDARIVLIRQNGLWGSRFSYGYNGKAPNFFQVLFSCFKFIVLNGLFFIPKRTVTYEFVEPKDFPKNGNRFEINSYLESFFNENAQKNTYVPYFFWESQEAQTLLEPEYSGIKNHIGNIPVGIKNCVIMHLQQLSGIQNISDTDHLSFDLGLDSLSIVEIQTWIQQEFGFCITAPESLQTVNDVHLAAMGKGINVSNTKIKPASKKWLYRKVSEKLVLPEGKTITEIFLKQALKKPRKQIVADQIAGEKTYRDLLIGIHILKKSFAAEESPYLGILLPASISAITSYFSALFAGKIPVMINWTTGIKNVQHAVDSLGFRKVVSSKALLQKLSNQGLDFAQLHVDWIFLEDVVSSTSRLEKLKAICKATFFPKNLEKHVVPEIAAILFTSGSETLPKAVPLSHKNLLANLKDISEVVSLYPSDTLMGILPLFHSFGLTVTGLLALCLGIKVVYHPNPTESVTIAEIIQAYRASLIVTTPTFLQGIFRAAPSMQLDSLRLAVVGAEKCSENLYKHARQELPNLIFLEGYGVTECSPVIATNLPGKAQKGTVGNILPSYRYKIVHPESFQEVKQGDSGLLIVKGDSVFRGYLGDSVINPFVSVDGEEWYNTGDLVAKDEEDRIVFKGRLKRFIKIGGEMISLPAIEETLKPYFEECFKSDSVEFAVESCAVEDHAEIILFTIHNVDRQKINQYLRDAGLSPLHNIRKVVVVSEIPMLGTGKTDYKQLSKLLLKS